MTRTVLILSTLMTLSLSGMAQDMSYIYRTGGILNGRAWSEWSHDVKLGYITGYQEHWEAAYDTLDERSEFGREVFAVPLLTIPEIVHGLDAFYAEPTNARINIRVALRILSAKATGASGAEVQEMTDQARRDAMKPDK